MDVLVMAVCGALALTAGLTALFASQRMLDSVMPNGELRCPVCQGSRSYGGNGQFFYCDALNGGHYDEQS